MEPERDSILEFKAMDDEAKAEAYQSALQTIAQLSAKVNSLEQRLAERSESPRPEQEERPTDHICADDVSSDMRRIQEATQDLICGLLAPVIDRLGKLESALSGPDSHDQTVAADTAELSPRSAMATPPSFSKPKTQDASNSTTSPTQLSTAALSSVPAFSRDVVTWFHQTDYWMKIYRVPDEVAVPLIISKMPSKDFAWMRHELKAERLSTWSDVKSAVRRRYHLDKPVEAAQRMYARAQRQGESCVDYAVHKLELMDECGFTSSEEERCEIILASVSSQVKRRYFDRTFTSLEQLMDSLLSYDRASSDKETPRQADKPRRSSPAPVRRLDCAASTSSPHRQEKPRPVRMPSSDAAPAKKQSPRQKSRSFVPSVKAPSQKIQSGIMRLCLNCKRQGHFVTRCPEPLSQEFRAWQESFVVSPSLPAQQGN